MMDKKLHVWTCFEFYYIQINYSIQIIFRNETIFQLKSRKLLLSETKPSFYEAQCVLTIWSKNTIYKQGVYQSYYLAKLDTCHHNSRYAVWFCPLRYILNNKIFNIWLKSPHFIISDSCSKQLAEENDCMKENSKCSKTSYGICKTNSFSIDLSDRRSYLAIFPTISRLNHSCQPNCNHYWSGTQFKG